MTMEHRKHVAGKQVLKTVCPCPVDNVAILLSGGMARTGFQGRKVGESVDIWRRMPPPLTAMRITLLHAFFSLRGS